MWISSEGGTCSRLVDAHHIPHWADGVETSMDNLVLLCRRHHRLVHEEGYGIQSGVAGDTIFTLPDGRPVPNNRHGRFRGNVKMLKARNRDQDLKITAYTAVPHLDDGRMDYDMAVGALVQREWCRFQGKVGPPLFPG